MVGHHPAGRPWRVGLSGSREHVVNLADAALATSSGLGSPFEPSGQFNHLLDPATGRCADPLRSIVVSAEATTADAMATALTLMSTEQANDVLERAPAGTWLA